MRVTMSRHINLVIFYMYVLLLIKRVPGVGRVEG